MEGVDDSNVYDIFKHRCPNQKEISVLVKDTVIADHPQVTKKKKQLWVEDEGKLKRWLLFLECEVHLWLRF